MKSADLFRKYRQSINPPYSRKDIVSVLATIFILIAIPLTVISVFRSEEMNKNPKAASTFTLGMQMFANDDTNAFDGWVDDLLANGITNMRIGRNYYDSSEALSKAAAIRMVKRGVKVTWLVSSNNFTFFGISNATHTITQETWPTFKAAILADAAWAQTNGMYEFQIGNEEELHLWRHPVSLVRDGSNTVTATFTEAHGFTSANPINIWTVDSANGDFGFSGSITVTSPTTFTYTKSGNAGSVAHPANMYIGNMPENTIQTNMKTLATYIKANSIYTRGNISYTTTGQYFMDEWHTLGRGDIDILAFNVYTNQDGWAASITNQVNWWGADHTYLTEFSLNSTSLDSYSPDETVQATGLASMIATIKAAGITRANFFDYIDADFGARKADGTYRKIWNVLVASQSPSDTSPPTGGSIIYTGGDITSASVALTVNDGTDAGSGINTSSRIIQRRSAALSNGTCGSYGAWSTIPLTGSYPNFTDTPVSSGNCYQYQYLVSDNTGIQATYSPLDLGMVIHSPSYSTTVFDSYVDDLLANGITNLRIDIPDYQEGDAIAKSKLRVPRAIAKGAKVTWGVSSNSYNKPAFTITASNWSANISSTVDSTADTTHFADNALTGVDGYLIGTYFYNDKRSLGSYISGFNAASDTVTLATPIAGMAAGDTYTIKGFRASILNAAVWAQANEVYEFQIGNEEELHTDTYRGTGTTMTTDQLQANLKEVATYIKANSIYTRGNISYTTTDPNFVKKWQDSGRGDIDILAFNIYLNQYDPIPSDTNRYVNLTSDLAKAQTTMADAISWWGADHTYITEFSLNYISLDNYSTDEAVQAAGLASMIATIKVAGITRADFYEYIGDDFGARKWANGTLPYRQLWNTLKSNVNTVKVTVSNTCTKVGDINCDQYVNIYDLSILLSRWGSSDTTADLSKNGVVDIFDLSILLSNWGK